MAVHIIEFKARVANLEEAEALLKTRHPIFHGEDVQTDTYYHVEEGRLKLRQGNIENALIWYSRAEMQGHKHSEVLLHKYQPGTQLPEILEKLHGIKIQVVKKRRIYFIENVKFHFDTVDGLGDFIEVEAIDEKGDIGMEKLRQQCDKYAEVFDVQTGDYVAASYSDLLLQQNRDRQFPTLQTERLLLRRIRQDDIVNVFRGLSDPQITRYFAVSFNSLEATQEQMQWYAGMLEKNTGRCWAVCSADNNTFYGVCTINFWNRQHRKAETGYWFFPEYWGKGLAAEAMQAVLQFGFNELNLHRISAEVEPDNTASIRLLSKLGFTKEGTMQQCEIKDGRFINLDVYVKFSPAEPID